MAKSMRQQLEAIAKKRGVDIESMIKGAVIQAANVAVIKSPVGNPDLWKSPPPPGYVGGQLRANWRISLNSMDSYFKNTTNYSGVMTDAVNDLISFSLGDDIYFTNPAPYARRIEYDSWSSQAPDGMARPAVVALKAALNKGVKDV